jgi:hypothetical protein
MASASVAKKPQLDAATLTVVKQVLALPPKPHDQMKVGRKAKKKGAAKGRASSSKP